MKTAKALIFFTLMILSVSAFGGNEDKFIKKYAMMKIYESCFGPEVVKQIRKEMKAACAKCALLDTSSVSPLPIQENKIQSPTESNQDVTKQGSLNNELPNDNDNTVNPPLNFDPEKLHQAILAYRPNPFQPTFRPFPPNTGYYPGYVSPGPLYYPTNPGFQQSPVSYTPAYPNFSPFYQPTFFGSQRMSREMDIKGQIEALTSRMSGRVRNVTCIMQELGYLDDKLQPNYEKIQSKIATLPISNELKQDIQDGVTFCQQFSQCVPEIKKDKSPLSNELIRPMFFFRCYKHKKLEACVMKDVRDRFSANGEDNFDTLTEPEIEVRRTGKSGKLEDKEVDDIATSVYEFLYGSESMDFESIL